MKNYAIFESRPQNVSNHNRVTNGWIFHGLVEDEKEFFGKIQNWEDRDFFQEDDGSVNNQNGDQVFDPERPEHFVFHDYTYHCVKLIELNDDQTTAVMQSDNYDRDEALDLLDINED